MYRKKMFMSVVVCIVLGLTLFLSHVPTAHAAVIPVNTLLDEYDLVPNATCSLREALESANTNAAFGGCPAGSGAEVDVILLVAGDYILTLAGSGENLNVTGDLDILDIAGLTIEGGGATINGNALDRVLHHQAGTTTLTNLNIINGVSPTVGGGIYAETAGSLFLTNVLIRDNTSVSDGGGISTTIPITLTASYVRNNATSGGDGAGIFASAPVDLNASGVFNNTGALAGGGIFLNNAPLILQNNSWVNTNAALTSGGGIYANGPNALVTVTTTNINGNTIAAGGQNGAGIALFNGADLTMTTSSMGGNTNNGAAGGGIYAQADGVVLVTGSTIQGNTALTSGGGIFVTGAGASVVLDNVQVATNGGTTSGGGVYVTTGATLQVLNNSMFASNYTSGPGGAIFVGGTGNASVANTVFNLNTAGANGGAIERQGGGSLTITNTTVTDNMSSMSGGGIHMTGGGLLSLSGGVIVGNDADDNGGGVFVGASNLNATNLTIGGNSTATGSGAGIYATGASIVSLDTVTLQGNTATVASGGGIYADNTTVTIIRSAIVGNIAGNTGGGIQASVPVQIIMENSTISGNTATMAGGGLSTNSTGIVSLNNVTITGNTGVSGGIAQSGGLPIVTNTIIAGNSATGTDPDCSGNFTSSGYNVIGINTNCAGFTDPNDQVGTAATPIDPMLGVLALNGGTTQNHEPQSGSPAINHGNNGTCISPDQRGTARPVGGVCDVGSVEAPFINTAPTWTATPPNQTVFVNETLTLPQSTFRDPDTFQAFTAPINWGDGSLIGNGTVNYTVATGNGTVDWPTHAYAATGIYPATITISDGTAIDTATFTVTVYPPAVLSKVFNLAAILAGETSTLTFTITNPAGNPALNGLTFTDTLPAGVTLAANVTTPQCGGAVTGTAGTAAIGFSGGTLLAGPSTCTITASVTSSAAGTYTNNATNISGLSTNLTATGLTATLTVTEPVATLSKAFAPAAILAGETSTLTFTLTNAAGNPALNGLAFTDTLPAGLTLAANVTTPQCGGAVTGTAGTAAIGFSSGTVAVGPSTCTITASVTSATAGTYTNNETNISGLSTNLTATGLTATLTVNGSATMDKVFAPAAIGAGGTSTLTFTLTNPAGNTALNGLAFTDTLPAGLVLAANVTTPQCGGAVTGTAGTAAIGFSGGTLAVGPSTCTITASITSSAAGTYTNNDTNITGLSTNLTAAGLTATLTVTDRVVLSKVFAPATILAGTETTLTFTISNPAGNPAQTGITFTDTLPTNVTALAVIAPTCPGGTLTIGGGDTTLTLANGQIGAGPATCTFVATVTSDTVGTYTNNETNISGLSANLVATGLTATLTVDQPIATLSKAFAPDSIAVGDNSTLTFTITNPAGNPSQSGLTFTDELPLNVFPVGTGANSCGATVIFRVIGGGAAFIEVTDGGVDVGPATCTIEITVTSATPGVYTNDEASISDLSANLDATGLLAVLTVDVADQARLGKQFTPAQIEAGRTASLTFTIRNAAGNPAQTGLAFTDTLPAGLTVSGVPAAAQCGGNVSATATVITFTGGSLAAGAVSCSITVTVTGNTPGAYTNNAGNISGLIGLVTGANIATTLTIADGPVTPPGGDEPSAEDHARAQAPLCALIGGGTNPIIRADVQSGTVTDGSVFCRILAQDGTYILTPAEVGIEAVVDLGVIHAVDVFGLRHGGQSDTHFNYGVKVCLQGTGRLLYLDATQAPRPVNLLTSTAENGYTCAIIPNAGTVVLVP